MASTKDFLDFVLDQIKDEELVRHKKMFGEYAIYYDEKVIGFICDNKLYLKDTQKGREFVGEDLRIGHPYPRAKEYILLEEEIEDRDFLNELIEITREGLENKK